jgi:hypothetical protein
MLSQIAFRRFTVLKNLQGPCSVEILYWISCPLSSRREGPDFTAVQETWNRWAT